MRRMAKDWDWMVNCQTKPPEYQDSGAIINYLAAYLVGSAIGNGRVISDDGQQVTIRYKDYTAGDTKPMVSRNWWLPKEG